MNIFQSTHPSGVRHEYLCLGRSAELISIHAPQWGATSQLGCCRCSVVYFNPRTPVGCDFRHSSRL